MAHEQPLPQEPPSPQLHGLVAEFDSADALIEAAGRVREAGYTKFECYSPHPVHGIDRAMGTPYSPIPWFVLIGGLIGTSGAILMQCWMNGWDYPLLVSGKPYISLPAQIPIAFELTVLVAGITAFVGMIGLNKLFQYYHPLDSTRTFKRVTDDRYALVIDADDPNFRLKGTGDLLTGAGATELEPCYETYQPADPPRLFWQIIVVLMFIGLIPAAVVFRSIFTVTDAPPLRIDNGMAYQEKFKGQYPNTFFAATTDNAANNRQPLSGTVGFQSTFDEHFHTGKVNGQFVTSPPKQIRDRLANEADAKALLDRGQRQFTIYCAQCHGIAGYGDGMIHRVADERARQGQLSLWVPPKSFHDPLIASKPDGEFFDTITNGKNKMWGYGYRIPPEDRWAIILYVRALYRSQIGKPPPPGIPPATTPSSNVPAGQPTKQ
jgi:mono/diheme cytochrome c family protein